MGVDKKQIDNRLFGSHQYPVAPLYRMEHLVSKSKSKAMVPTLPDCTDTVVANLYPQPCIWLSKIHTGLFPSLSTLNYHLSTHCCRLPLRPPHPHPHPPAPQTERRKSGRTSQAGNQQHQVQ